LDLRKEPFLAMIKRPLSAGLDSYSSIKGESDVYV
jgi:hypothetical protein